MAGETEQNQKPSLDDIWEWLGNSDDVEYAWIYKQQQDMKITNAIVWDHRGRVPKGGVGQLEVRITIERKSYYFGTGIKVRKS